MAAAVPDHDDDRSIQTIAVTRERRPNQMKNEYNQRCNETYGTVLYRDHAVDIHNHTNYLGVEKLPVYSIQER